MAKWIAAEKVRAGLRHAVECPNVTGRIKARTAQSKRARAGSLAIVDKPHVARICILRAILFRFHIFAFIAAAALRSIVQSFFDVHAPESHTQ